MKIETTTKVYDEDNKELRKGDVVIIYTKGNTYYKVIVKDINPGNISIWINHKDARTIAYKDITSLWIE